MLILFEFKKSDSNGPEILFEEDVKRQTTLNGPRSGDNEQKRSPSTAGESLAKDRSELPTSRSVATVPWKEVAPPGQGTGLRPFVVTTANLESAVSASDWGQRRIEAEEIWFVRATDREDAIYRIWDLLKPAMACVDAFDVVEMRALACRAEELCPSDETHIVKVATPWCAEVAFAN